MAVTWKRIAYAGANTDIISLKGLEAVEINEIVDTPGLIITLPVPSGGTLPDAAFTHEAAIQYEGGESKFGKWRQHFNCYENDWCVAYNTAYNCEDNTWAGRDSGNAAANICAFARFNVAEGGTGRNAFEINFAIGEDQGVAPDWNNGAWYYFFDGNVHTPVPAEFVIRGAASMDAVLKLIAHETVDPLRINLRADGVNNKFYIEEVTAITNNIDDTRVTMAELDVTTKAWTFPGDIEVGNLASKTTAAWNKSIGSGGDYADWATMIADMPDLIAHAVTVTIKAGTTLTEICELKYKHGITKDGVITILAEKSFPTSGVIPTADSATIETLRDAALATAALGDDYFNGCWIFIVDGTGTDNGFVPITDYIDATGDVKVANWPGTQPDNTSRYLIVGALIDGESTRCNCIDARNNSIAIYFRGIGLISATEWNLRFQYSSYLNVYYAGFYNAGLAGVFASNILSSDIRYSGFVSNNTDNNSGYGGIALFYGNHYFAHNACSDNKRQGVIVSHGSNAIVTNCFGDNNGVWGTFASHGGQVDLMGGECSGSSGTHSDPGTAGTANADQASAY